MNFISLFRKSGKPEKVVDESVLTDTFVKTIKDRLMKCLSKSILNLPIIVEQSAIHSPNGREWLLSSGEGYVIRDVVHLQGRLLKGFLVDLAGEFGISSTDEGQLCLSILLDESQGQISDADVVWGTSLMVVAQSAVYRAIEWIPDDVLDSDFHTVRDAYEGLLVRNLTKDLSDFFKENPRLVEALSRLDASQGARMVTVKGGLKSIMDKALQKDTPVLFNDLYTRDTTNTFKQEAR
ncbi:hypothetical protein AO073_01610 [Pseudomonas syringae ICMP 11293]|uniref:hypothetical protein n=1 Tax=Pseudomonas syringae TaxID=317 RepID=UPI0007318175|nr:hypothetical protein [Pseudomonas syringae]KTB91597.1 hypothetical protein AO073_01610 [Pseudomonas syringae ICMP 11293]